MKKIICSLICSIIVIFLIGCVNSCDYQEESDIINEISIYEISYKDSINCEGIEILEEIEPQFIAKKINMLRKGRIHECNIETTEGHKILNIRNDEIICKMYFDTYLDGTIHYTNYTLEHLYKIRNYGVIQKGMKMHSMYNNDYAAEFIGEIVFKTNHDNKLMYVLIPFHVKCYFNLNENKCKFVMDI